ncbi:MAG TPA: hypothetical protein VGR76_04685 [Candidatus Angelobacter sp.]|jgi:hypothetical protein|nr:hypothetical protein [Candidatus Angelobacter sp.]
MADNTKTAKMWQEAASATAECLPLEVLERMTENASADSKAAAHLAGCAHCQTELAMLKNFEQATPSADEGAAVAWIAAQLERRQSAPVAQQKIARVPFWRTMFRVPYLAGAAALAAVLIFGISLYHGNSDGPGRINPGLGNGQFRSGAIHLVSPITDQNTAPTEFRWDAVQGASSYTVELKDVAGITLATANSTQNTLSVTPEMKANMISGKPLKWQVTAKDANGKEIANSSGGEFKVR